MSFLNPFSYRLLAPSPGSMRKPPLPVPQSAERETASPRRAHDTAAPDSGAHGNCGEMRTRPRPGRRDKTPLRGLLKKAHQSGLARRGGPPWPPVSDMSICVAVLRREKHGGHGQAQGPVPTNLLFAGSCADLFNTPLRVRLDTRGVGTTPCAGPGARPVLARRCGFVRRPGVIAGRCGRCCGVTTGDECGCVRRRLSRPDARRARTCGG